MNLFVIGTDLSYKTSRIFSYQTTPQMEVAEAVRISMSIPLYFESIKINDNNLPILFSDGGIMRNYPINIFDNKSVNYETLGFRFKTTNEYKEINNLIQYITALFHSFLKIQQDIYENSPKDIARTVEIKTGGLSPLNFNIEVNDEIYNYLFYQGYYATLNFIKKRIN